MISENKKKLISLLTRYDSRKFIESIIAILDSEEEVSRLLRFVEDNPDATKTDVHEEVIKIKRQLQCDFPV